MRMNLFLAIALVGIAFVGVADTAAAAHSCNLIPPGNARNVCVSTYNAVCGVAEILVECPIT